MKRPFRFYAAILITRFSRWVLKKLGRNATQVPGNIALKLCPDFLKYLEKPEFVIGVTGTNGKTTVANLIGDVLRHHGIAFANNSLGGNIVQGIITALLETTSMLGNNKVRYGVLEIDERASLLIFPYVQPDYLIVTNLFRDSYSRNAHVEFIQNILNRSIPEKTTIITNADDMIVSSLVPANAHRYFSLKRLDGEPEVKDSLIRDLIYCPSCHEKLVFDYTRYHHIGTVHCPHCGWHNPEADLIGEMVDYDKHILKIRDQDEIFEYPLIGTHVTDMYNMLSAVLGLRVMGFAHETLIEDFKTVRTVETRFNEVEVGGKRIVRLLTKDQNPIANSRIFDTIRHDTRWGNLAIIIDNETYAPYKELQTIENVAWIYDADFEYLAQPKVKQIIARGHRTKNLKIRLLMAGISPDRIRVFPSLEPLDDKIDYQAIDTVIILYGTKNITQARELSMQIERDLSGKEKTV